MIKSRTLFLKKALIHKRQEEGQEEKGEKNKTKQIDPGE